jgi:hypothetical protein
MAGWDNYRLNTDGFWDSVSSIEFINNINKNKNMSFSQISRLFKNKDTRILEDAGVTLTDGSFTNYGIELVMQMFLKKNKKEVVELAKQLIEDRK